MAGVFAECEAENFEPGQLATLAVQRSESGWRTAGTFWLNSKAPRAFSEHTILRARGRASSGGHTRK